MNMEEVDHYSVLGLPSSSLYKFTEAEIIKAYRLKALKLHPDKRPDDPHAQVNFQKLKTSYEILKDERTRKLVDDSLLAKRDRAERQSQQDAKRHRMINELEERERANAFPFSTRRSDEEEKIAKEREQRYKAFPFVTRRSDEEEDRIAKKLKEEIDTIRAMFGKKNNIRHPPPPPQPATQKDDPRRYVSVAEYEAFEDLVMEKLWKAAERQKAGAAAAAAAGR